MFQPQSVELLLKNQMDTELRRQGNPLSEEAEAYLVMRLASVERWDHDFSGNRTIVGSFLETPRMGRTASRQVFQTIGDTSLLAASTGSWQRYFGWRTAARSIPISYFVNMGELAYEHLAPERPFEELADRFRETVNVLTQVFRRLGLRGDSDLLSVYTRWLATGSAALAIELQLRGVTLPATTDTSPS